MRCSLHFEDDAYPFGSIDLHINLLIITTVAW